MSYDIKRRFGFMAIGPNGGTLFDPVNREATSSPSGPATELWVEPRYSFLFGSWEMQPTMGLRSAWYHVGDWAETGADALSLGGPARTTTSVQGDVGLRLSRAIGRFRPFASGMYRRELTSGDTTATVQLGDVPGGLFEIDGLAPPRDRVLGQGGVTFLQNRFGLSVLYEIHASSVQTRQSLQLGVGF